MKPKEIRDLSEQEIEQRIKDDEHEMSNLAFQQAIAGLENPLVLRARRREIARLKTILKQKQAEAHEA
ncbi:MAG: 50S ribosomal protein L29 [Bacteroidetes bacterium]|nr:50S ribosomal protein L29 [Bacteroidota bacterium]